MSETLSPPTYHKTPGEQIFESAEAVGIPQRLEPNTPYDINLNAPLTQSTEGAGVAAIITAGPASHEQGGFDQFAIVDLRHIPIFTDKQGNHHKAFEGMWINPSLPFMLVSKSFDPRDTEQIVGYKGIRPGDTINIGSEDETTRGRFALNNTTSRKHFTVALNETGDNLQIWDRKSTNGTTVKTATPLARGDITEQNKHLNLSPDMQAALTQLHDHLSKGRSEGLDEQALLGVIGIVNMLRQKEPDEKKLKRRLLRHYHPDRYQDDPERAAKKQALFEAAAFLIDGRQK